MLPIAQDQLQWKRKYSDKDPCLITFYYLNFNNNIYDEDPCLMTFFYIYLNSNNNLIFKKKKKNRIITFMSHSMLMKSTFICVQTMLGDYKVL